MPRLYAKYAAAYAFAMMFVFILACGGGGGGVPVVSDLGYNDSIAKALGSESIASGQSVEALIKQEIAKLKELLVYIKANMPKNGKQLGTNKDKVKEAIGQDYKIPPGELVSHINRFIHFVLEEVLEIYQSGDYDLALQIYDERKEEVEFVEMLETVDKLFPEITVMTTEIAELEAMIRYALLVASDDFVPVVSIQPMPTSGKLRVEIRGTCIEEGSGIAAIYARANDGEWRQSVVTSITNGASWVVDLSLEDGQTNRIYAYAVDNAGNTHGENGEVWIDIEVDSSVLDAGDVVWEFRTVPEGYFDHFYYSSPVIADGKVYVGTTGGWITCKLFCLDLKNGKPLWMYPLGQYGLVMTCPAIEDGKLYITTGYAYGGGACSVYAFDVTGDAPVKLWQYTTPEPIKSGPAVYKGRVYVTGYNRVLSFDANHNNPDVPPVPQIIPLPGDTTYQCAIAVHDDKIYVGSSNNYSLYSCHSLDGSLLWEHKRVYDSKLNTAVELTPTIGDTKMLGGFYNYPFGVDPGTGENEWMYIYLGDYYASPIYYKNPTNGKEIAYYFNSNGDLLCLDAATGAFQWNTTHPWGDVDVRSAPIYSGGKIYMNNNGSVHMMIRCLDGNDGSMIWERFYINRSNAWSNPAMSENKLVVCASNHVMCVKTPNSNSEGKDWPMLGQNNRRTQSFLGDAPPVPEQPDGGEVMWKVDDPNINKIMSTQITYTNSEGGRILFVGCKDQLYTDTKLYCYDANPYTNHQPATKVWEFPIGNTCVGSSPTIIRNVTVNGQVRDVAYFAGEQKAYCIDMKTGAELWSADTGGWGWRSAVYVDGPMPKVYFSTQETNNPGVFCFNAQTGEKLWSHLGSEPEIGCPAYDFFIDLSYSSATNSIYALTYRNPCKVICFDADTGAFRWAEPLSITTPINQAGGSIVASGGKVYVSTIGGLYMLEDNVGAASVVWQSHPAYGTYSPVVIDGNFVYSKLNGGTIIRYDKALMVGNYLRDTSFIIETYVDKWSTFAISAGFIYTGVKETTVKLQCFDTLTGARIWNAAAGDSGEAATTGRGGPAVAADSPWNSFSYYATDNGKILCVSSKESNGGSPWSLFSHDEHNSGTTTP